MFSKTESNQPSSSFRFRDLAAYSAPALAFSFPLIPFAVYLPSFYAVDLAFGFVPVAVALFVANDRSDIPQPDR